MQITAKAGVLPAGTLPRILLPADLPMEIKILAIDPENGYSEEGKPIPSEHEMVKVQYPDGYIKNHQIKDLRGAELLAKIQNLLQTRYAIQSFEFDKIPAFKAGVTIKLLEVK